MKVAACHNYYQIRGGEDESFEDLVGLLRAKGHQVSCFTKHNDDIDSMSRWTVARNTLWNRTVRRELTEFLRKEKPDLVHFTNTFPRFSPSCYSAAKSVGAPVVQALRNYRVLCANGTFFRDGQVCEDCIGKRFAGPAVRHKCYRGSRAGTTMVAALQSFNRLRGTWQRDVDLFYTPSRFARDKLVSGGLPADRVMVRPNFVTPDPGPGSGAGGYVLFIGRLSPEKGISTLMAAWRRAKLSVDLKIIGEGPMAKEVAEFAAERQDVHYLGKRPRSEVLSMLGDAKCLAMTSTWYETFGRTIIEAFSRGTPVVASRLGAMQELLDDGRTGFLFQPGDEADLAAALKRVCTLPQQAAADMRRRARREYERAYTPEASYVVLQDMYRRAFELHAERVSRNPQASSQAIVATPPLD